MFAKGTLRDKSFLITGGGSGLGLGIAKRFAELGANVAICGRTKEALEKAARELEPFGTKIETYSVDVSDYEAVGTLFERLASKWGSLDGLVNNAGANFLCFSEELSPNGFKAVVDIVLHGTFNCSQHFAKYLIGNKRPGSILNIVTTYTETGSAFILPSACSKAGVYAMTTLLWAVPFNKLHGLKILKLTEDSIEIKIPYRRTNLNHLKGLHACVLAASTEYAMGLLLMSHLNPAAHRIIIQSLRMTYHYQGKTDCAAKFLIQRDWFEQQVAGPLKTRDAVVVNTTLKVFDAQDHPICTGEVSWQIKHRGQAKTR